jgi:ribonuclease D
MLWKNNDTLDPITRTDTLKSLCDQLCQQEFITIDTEFLRDSTYWPKLCLIQVAGKGVEALIDPLAEGLDLAPLYALLANHRVTKVFHAARQDLEIFYQRMGQVPCPVFDSQIAAAVLGLGDSISYENLVSTQLDKRVDKSSRFTDWAQRPLSESQRRYALADVTHLREIYPKLRDRIGKLGRESWISEAMAVLTAEETYALDPQDSWKRMKLRKTTKPYLAALKMVAAWREAEAQKRDIPRQRILKDDVIYEIAQRQPKSLEEIGRMRGIPGGFAKSSRANGLMEALQTAYRDPEGVAPKLPPRTTPSGPTPTNVVGFLKLLLQVCADEHEVAARLIATTADLERFAMIGGRDDPLMQGWRGEVFGTRALALKTGQLALRLDGDNVVLSKV